MLQWHGQVQQWAHVHRPRHAATYVCMCASSIRAEKLLLRLVGRAFNMRDKQHQMQHHCYILSNNSPKKQI